MLARSAPLLASCAHSACLPVLMLDQHPECAELLAFAQAGLVCSDQGVALKTPGPASRAGWTSGLSGLRGLLCPLYSIIMVCPSSPFCPEKLHTKLQSLHLKSSCSASISSMWSPTMYCTRKTSTICMTEDVLCVAACSCRGIWSVQGQLIAVHNIHLFVPATCFSRMRWL